MERGGKMSPLLSASGLSLEVHCNVYRRKISSFTFYLITREATVLLTANFAAHVSDTLQVSTSVRPGFMIVLLRGGN